MAETFDVVLFGPTGVTGREVARHLARRAPELGLTWAVAGRNEERMRETLATVGAEPGGVLVADVADEASIRRMVGRATVVANLVGPYADYGEPVYAACAEAGVAQLDLTGELDWVRAMIVRYGDSAAESGARIVPTAGFESLPFDLAVHLAAATAAERYGEPLVSAAAAVVTTSTAKVSGMSDMVSGGTYGSMVGLVRRGPGRGIADPFLLDPPGSGAATGGRISLLPRRHAGTHQWLAPMLPAAYINPAVVHRGAALSRLAGEDRFAPGFRYREGSAVDGFLPEQAKRLEPVLAPVTAGLLGGTQLTLSLGTRAPRRVRDQVASFMERIGPKPGEGPRPETLDDWSYRIDVRGTTASGRTVDVVVEAEGHPGYKSTARLVGEAALLLADPSADRPAAAGFLTPATALGLAEIDRFAEAGCTFTLR